MGQIFNIFAVLGLFPIAKKIGGSNWSGVVSLVVAGLLISMPNFYTNWGRYTQLAGQVLLPAVIICAWWLQEKNKISVVRSILLGLLMGGLGLVHYRVLIFAIILLFVLVVDQLIRDRNISLISNFSISTITGLIVFLPWLLNLKDGKILGNAIGLISTPANLTSEWIQQYNSLGDLSIYLPNVIWALMIMSSFWAIFKHERKIIAIVAWWILLLLAANPQVLGLPGQGVLSNFAILIAMYIPAALLIGGAVYWLQLLTPAFKKIWPPIILIVACIGGY
ncbi:MAG: hypothetical protein ACXADB_11715, partial [Candidatus Hermodarchaeia archaeon]